MPKSYTKHISEIEEQNDRICYENAKKYGHTKEEADKCDATENLVCPFCPFITK